MSRPTAPEAPALPRYTIDCASNEYGTHWNVEGDSGGSLCLFADAQAALDKLTAERDAALERAEFMFRMTRDAQDVASLANERWAAIQGELVAAREALRAYLGGKP